VSLSLLSLIIYADFSQGNNNPSTATAFTGGQTDFVSFSMTHILQNETSKLTRYTVADSMQGNTNDDYPSIDLSEVLREVFEDDSTLGHGQDLQYSLVSHPSFTVHDCAFYHGGMYHVSAADILTKF
jgi:hypothetical protein